MAKVRTYKANLERSRAGLSAEEIHRGKCAAKRAARETRKELNKQAQAKQQSEAKKPDYPVKQLARLDFRLGICVGAHRERKRLCKKLTVEQVGNYVQGK